MKYIGIDYGAKRVGIAISDGEGRIAFPRTTMPNDDNLMARLQEVIRVEKIDSIVIGDTKTHGGEPNPISAEADTFARSLAGQSKLPVDRGWELWSSMEVGKSAIKGHEHDDSSAAAFILQRFLDMQKNDGSATGSRMNDAEE